MAKVTPEDFVAALEEWTVLDVVNAVKLMEEKLGITAAAPVAVAAALLPAPPVAVERLARPRSRPSSPSSSTGRRRRQDQRHQDRP